ncbi:MAG: histidine phosphatase family protein [Pseudomonadota bacterium]|nr:histidine phosphatase family protein [Pseudomonadota bacterium]
MLADPHEAQLTRVIAIRHGETVWNAEMRMQGQLDTNLSPRGRWQAGRVAAGLGGEGIDAVIASDLARAFDTAQAIAKSAGVEVEVDTGLRERGFGVFEGYTYAEIDQRWPTEAARWRRHDPDFGPDEGETLRDFYRRSVSTATAIAARHAGRSIALVTHGGVLDCLYRAASNVSLDAPRSWQLGNAAINRLLYTPRGFTLIGWSDTTHLDGEMLLDDSDEGGSRVPTPKARLA